MDKSNPYWMPDTQGFLAIAIIGAVSILAFLLLLSTVHFDDKVAGAFMTLLGVLAACLKDVYGFFFGSSAGSAKKDEVMAKMAGSPSTGNAPSQTSTTTTVEPGKTVTEVQPAPAAVAPIPPIGPVS